MPKAELTFPNKANDGPMFVTVEERDRRGILKITASQNGETAFIELNGFQWWQLFNAIFSNLMEKKP